ncbi:MAG: hypothetical protein ABIR53_04460 [Paraperlucidibaca sp.]
MTTLQTEVPSPEPSEPTTIHRQARGEERRMAILRATWQVVLSDGVRGVKHRAVAKAAGVPLASTTYYFKDIQELLVQSFQLFAAESLAQFAQPFWQRAEAYLAALPLDAERELVEMILVDLAAEFIELRLNEHREHLVMEYAFWYAALHDEQLEAAVRDMALAWFKLLMPCLKRFKLANEEQAARTLLSAVRRVEYEGLIHGSASYRDGWIREALAYQVRGLW